MRTRALLHALLAALLLASVVSAPVASEAPQEAIQVMDVAQQEYGKPNPEAPQELSQFAFLIGQWRCDHKTKRQDGTYETLQATWIGRYILDGYVIADEYRLTGPAGELVLFGQNYRSYSTAKKAWILKWHEVLTSTWLDLGPEELGGVRVNDTSITYTAQFQPKLLHRMTYFNISEDHFTWRGEASTDGGETWAEILVIEAYRVKN